MDIYYGDKIESIDLIFFLSLKNNKFIFDKKEVDINNKSNSSKLEDDILKFMVKNGTYKNDYYEYKIDNKTFKYYDGLRQLILERMNTDYIEIWLKELDKDYLSYSVRTSNDSSDSKVLSVDENNFNQNNELYDRFYNYLDKYILGKSN